MLFNRALLQQQPDIDGDGSDDVDAQSIFYAGFSLGGLMGNAVMAIVFWTGIIKWQLPRIKKWNRNRKKAAASNA